RHSERVACQAVVPRLRDEGWRNPDAKPLASSAGSFDFAQDDNAFVSVVNARNLTLAYAYIRRIQIEQRIPLRRTARRPSASALTAVLDSTSTHGRNTAASKFANRCSTRAIEIGRSRIELRGSHRGDETH